jgi:hypothetical protein
MRLAVKLVGFDHVAGTEDTAGEGAVHLVLPDDATPNDLLQHLAETYGGPFSHALLAGGRAPIRISVLIDNEALEDLHAPLAGLLRSQSEISVALLRPLGGG